jgi:hypothetical protein
MRRGVGLWLHHLVAKRELLTFFGNVRHACARRAMPNATDIDCIAAPLTGALQVEGDLKRIG